MNGIFATLAKAAATGERVALGILTRVNGSSPQRTGAKAVFHLDRKISGTLGGGCLEAEAQRLALNALKTGRPETFELVLDHDFGWDDGLICGGKVFGVVIPDAQLAGEKFWNELSLRDTPKTWGVKKDFTLARVEGSTCAEVRWGKAADGPAREDARPTDAPSIHHQQSTIHSPDSPDWLYTETIQPRCALWIAGSGHIAQAVAPLALRLDFDVSVFDDRPDLANHRVFPADVRLRVGDWGKILSEKFQDTDPRVESLNPTLVGRATPCAPGSVGWGEATDEPAREDARPTDGAHGVTRPTLGLKGRSGRRTFGLIVTRGHKHDALVLESWIHRQFEFLGMIGSARKARTIAEHFVRRGIATAEQVARVACPVGIEIASESVPEIAVSIMAQYIERRAKG